MTTPHRDSATPRSGYGSSAPARPPAALAIVLTHSGMAPYQAKVRPRSAKRCSRAKATMISAFSKRYSPRLGRCSSHFISLSGTMTWQYLAAASRYARSLVSAGELIAAPYGTTTVGAATGAIASARCDTAPRRGGGEQAKGRSSRQEIVCHAGTCLEPGLPR